MEFFMSIAIGLMFASAFYMMLRRSIVKLVIGLIILSNAANLLIFTAAGLVRGAPPFLSLDTAANTAMADPLPQALVLTAIVIAFGVLAFSVVLIHRAYQVIGTDDLSEMTDTDT